jgi:hypothetical protein
VAHRAVVLRAGKPAARRVADLRDVRTAEQCLPAELPKEPVEAQLQLQAEHQQAESCRAVAKPVHSEQVKAWVFPLTVRVRRVAGAPPVCASALRLQASSARNGVVCQEDAAEAPSEVPVEAQNAAALPAREAAEQAPSLQAVVTPHEAVPQPGAAMAALVGAAVARVPAAAAAPGAAVERLPGVAAAAEEPGAAGGPQLGAAVGAVQDGAVRRQAAALRAAVARQGGPPSVVPSVWVCRPGPLRQRELAPEPRPAALFARRKRSSRPTSP